MQDPREQEGVGMANLRQRFWLEAVGAGAALLLALATAVSPTWIERLFGVDPDQGSGALEWAVVAGLACIAVSLALITRVEWRRRTATTA